MFDIGFSELVLIGVIALIVIGPERLPEVARTVGKYVGRMRRFVAKVRDDIDREISQEELRDALKRNTDLGEIKNIINDTRYTIEDEITQTRQHVVEARDDDPRGNFDQKDVLKEQEDEFENENYGLSDHRDYGADELADDSAAGSEQSIEDEIKAIRQNAIEEHDEDPPAAFNRQDMHEEQEFDNEDYGLTDHRDYGADEQADTSQNADTQTNTNKPGPATGSVASSSKQDDGRNGKSDG